MYDFDNYKSALSEGKALAVVVQAVPRNPHWTWIGTIGDRVRIVANFQF